MRRRLRAALVVALVAACKRAGAGEVVLDPGAPTAEVYADGPSDFAGEWVGESAGVFGTLKIERLGAARYYGRFVSDDGFTRFVVNFSQLMATPAEGGDKAPANLATFTWQDGRGGQGSGWVLINPEDSALSGEIRYGGVGAWNFVRVDEAG